MTGVITSNQLIAAMHRWVDEKSRPLRQVLVALGFTDDAACERVMVSVNDLVRDRGNSVRASLKEVGLSSELQSQLTALRTYEFQFFGSRNVWTSSSEILAHMEGPEITHHTKLPMARCDAADMIDESGQACYRRATESIGCANDTRNQLGLAYPPELW